MCGIAALLAPEGRDLAPLIERMTRLVAHRGPDGEGYVLFEGPDLVPCVAGGESTSGEIYRSGTPFAPTTAVASLRGRTWRAALGHRRLSIVELTAEGHQPMSDGEGRFWIVYNGEIYNHVELRAQLKDRGYRFRSNSDTEVILAAYREWGADCLHRFNGMFAFVLLDRSENLVFAARDRFGVKPLYYWSTPDGVLALASEIKQFTALPGWRAVANRKLAHDFLARGLADHTSETLFTAVRQLRGGEMMLLRRGHGLEVRRWYELASVPFAGSFEEAAKTFGALFEDGVRLRLRADVSIGSCLSGGLDSSSIVCTVAGLLKRAGAAHPQKTVSARAQHPEFDEGPFIEAVVAKAGTASHEVYPALEELDEVMPLLVWHQDEPFGSTSIFAQWKVFELASRQGLKVMLDGQGADETLGGYPVFFSARLASLAARFHLSAFLAELREIRRYRTFPLMHWVRHFVYSTVPFALLGQMQRIRGQASKERRALSAQLATGTDHHADPGYRIGIHAVSRQQIDRTNLPILLHWEDRNSMAHAVESRLPFLDYRLVEFVLGLPEEYLLSEGTTKRILRAAMNGTLPDLVRNRTDKLGFATPEEIWVKREGRELFQAWMRRAIEQSRGLLTEAAIDHLNDVIAGRQPFTFFPWRLISFGAWMERFSVHT